MRWTARKSISNSEQTVLQHNSITGNILTPAGWVLGELSFAQRILAIDGAPRAQPDPAAPLILPGFIDLHVHGGAGRDVMQGGDAAAAIARLHARHGTTSLLATTMTAPAAELEMALRDLGQACQSRASDAARILGVHLEGPYINPGKLGAQPDCARPAQVQEVLALAQLAPIKLVTLAPEIPGHLELVRQLVEAGLRVQLGHTAASYEEAAQAMHNGATGFTHLYNAMSGLHHRSPGAVGAALAHAEYAELIPDLLHVHPGAIRAALRCIPKLFCVTDSTAASGMPDGPYLLGSQTVHKCLGGVRLADGTLAGSTLTMDQALRNLVSIGLDLADASRRLSTYAADFLGETERGRLQGGAHADMVVLDHGLNILQVYVEGDRCDFAHA